MEQRRGSIERASGASTPVAKKRPRLTAVTPIGIVQQRKRRVNPTPKPKTAPKPQEADTDDAPAETKDDDNSDDERVDSDNSDVELERQSKEDVRELWELMADEQRQRYGVYRRSALNKGTVKRLVSQILGQQVSSTLTFVVAGFSKVFIGEIVERAVQIRDNRGDEGALTPEHLREAYRQYKKETGTGMQRLF
ncbi:transcription initiation factor TFIID subunit 11 [Coemansia sp. RSA 921]|nr:transcription initiation factor TFIID subunit 11 [Coemansia sp. RSA 1591]KAJ1761107.1 transcription initiation factor TFIID subunit 11 [Coemansia sp. RSA 1752]KAJ1787743.1 transcription initiation factor TFIID subunit 11 [Coemansia sp. RSA 1938]KAJ2133286.1 transcription initiation factor TFIID subunit 11 [Coemansia sp. RSA 921]KAJ2136233.1 transcription initiation factor TFIID subunit 11 [Coemansia sp. RSA 788]KAJ2146016.1 transcription initiation factor TFIID subunit 11 [Coemansia sp. RSA